jgi:importin subunit alpha-2
MGELDKVSLHVEECLDRIEALQSHDNVEIYHKSLAILEQYFSTDVNYSFLLFLFLVLFQ